MSAGLTVSGTSGAALLDDGAISLLEFGVMSLLVGTCKSVDELDCPRSVADGLLPLEESSEHAAKNATESAMAGRRETLFFI